MIYYKKSLLALIFSLVCSNALLYAQSDTDSILSYTQQLINAISTGDTLPWHKYADAKCMITIEDGTVKTKEQFIHGMQKPPEYMMVSQAIDSPIFTVFPGIIVFSYTARQTLAIMENKRINDVVQTDTWYKTTKGWRLIGDQASDKPMEPLAQRFDMKILDSIVGEYKVNDTVSVKVFVRNEKLYSQRTGGKETELFCETDYMYYSPTRLQIKYIFIHDSSGHITRFIQRRAGRDLAFNKIN